MKSSTQRRLTVLILAALVAGAVFGIGLNVVMGALGAEHPATAFLTTWVINGGLQFLGQAFVRLLTLMVAPLVLVSLACGAASLDDARQVGRVGLKALGLYLATTALAVSLALGAAALTRPGAGLERTADVAFTAREAPSFWDTLLGLIPANIFAALAEAQMLPIIVFAILLGLALTQCGEAGLRVKGALEDINVVILRLVQIILLAAPLGVFGLVGRTFAREGFGAILPLGAYFFTVLGALLVHGTLVYSGLLAALGRLNPAVFFKKMREVHLFAFSTASSSATLPVTMETVQERLGVGRPVASFVVPLGATINMDGTAIMQGVATVFIAQVYGVELSVMDYLTVIATATLASIGTAGVPGVGLVMLSMVLTQVGLPVEGVGLILGIDRLLDMVRTAVNVTGDAMVACVVGSSEGQLDRERYASSNVG